MAREHARAGGGRTLTAGFRHADGSRTIVFGAGALDAAADLLDEPYTLLTTERAAGSAPRIAERAAAVVHVPAGLVEFVAAGLRPSVEGDRLVALGGGPADTPRVRPAVVIDDPALSASLPAEALAAGSANALGHATVGLASDRATPIGRAVAREAVAALVAGWSAAEPDRTLVALGALLAGWAVDHSGLGPHHALAQTAVRTASLAHAHANAALLPHTIRALRARRPDTLEVALERLAEALRERAGVDGLGAMATDEDLLDRAVEIAMRRPELGRVAPAPDRAEVRQIYRAAAG
jgi:maleylacetate reductase